MGKLRKTVQKEVYDSLDNSIFSSDDFEVQFGDSDGEWMVYISFKHEGDYRFSIGNPTGSGSCYILRSPGKLQEDEGDYGESFTSALSEIPNWCDEIRNELKASKPIYREVDELRKIIEEQFTNSLEDNDEFSVVEINNLNSRS